MGEVELRVLLCHRRLRRQRAVVQRERRLDEPGDASRGHRVADVGLDRAERGAGAVRGRPAFLVEERAQRRDLDHVADSGGGSVRLDVADRPRRHLRIGVGELQRLELAARARRHRAVAAPVVVAPRAADESVDAVAVALGVLAPLEQHRAHAFAHDEAVGLGVEGPALARARDGADAREADEVVGQEVHVDAACDREIDLSGAQVDDRLVRGHQRARACGVDGDGGSSQIELLRDRGRAHVQEVSGDGEGADGDDLLDQRLAQHLRTFDRAAERAVEELRGAQAREEDLLVLVGARADEDARALARVRPRLVARVLKGAADDVEQDAVLRIGDLDAAGRDAEVQRPELQHVLVVEVSAPVDVGLVGGAQRRVVERGVIPP